MNSNLFCVYQVEEALQLWNDRDFGGTASQKHLITALRMSRRSSFCQPLIEALETSIECELLLFFVRLVEKINMKEILRHSIRRSRN